MLRFLKSHKQSCLALMLVLCAIAIVAFFSLSRHLVVVVLLFVAMAVFLDEKAKKILDGQTSYVYGNKQVRNVDYLVIGDMADMRGICQIGKKTVFIQSPNRSLEGSFWVLKRMFSLLDEEHGKAIIAIKEKNINKHGITLFEYSFLSPIYINILGVRHLARQRKHPFFFSPFNSLRLVIGGLKKSSNAGCLSNEIADFCQQRGINVEFRLIR